MAIKDKSKNSKAKAQSDYSVDKASATSATAKTGSSKPVPSNANSSAKKSNKKKIVAVVIIIILLALLYLILTYGSIPVALLSGKLNNASSIESVVLSRLYSNNMVSLSYAGTVTINNVDPYVNIGFLKYYNDTQTSLNFTQFPGGIGNSSVIIISINNYSTGYGCLKVWNSAANESNPYFCNVENNGRTKSLVALALNRIVDVSSLGNMHIASVGLSSFEGQPCYTVAGTGNINVNGSLIGKPYQYVPSSFNFTSCVSAQYDIPYTLQGTMDMGNSQFMHVSINETGMGFVTNESQVTKLPPQV